MTPLTVACVWVKGNVDYPVEYVIRLRKMVARHLQRPHRFFCLTDRPAAFYDYYMQGGTGIGLIEIPTPKGFFGWWSKMELFNPANGLDGRVLYLDLDTLVVDDLAPIVDYPAAFALVPDAGNFKPKDGRKVVKRFNSSVMAWDAGTTVHQIWRLYAPNAPLWHLNYWGDQDFLGMVLKRGGAAMPLEWFPRLSELNATERDYGPESSLNVAKVILCKKPKNTEAAKRWPWFNEMWG